MGDPTLNEMAAGLGRPTRRPDPFAEVLPAALEARAFRGSEWPGDGSAAQFAIDASARRGISRRHQQALADIAAEERLTPDPMDALIEAEQKRNAYEGLRPYGSTSTIRASYGRGIPGLEGAEVGSDVVGERPLGVPSNAAAFAVRQKQAELQARTAPEMAEAQARMAAELDTMRRVGLYDQLVRERRKLEAAVEAGQVSREQADAAWAKVYQEAREMADILKTGYPPSNSLDGLIGLGSRPPSPAPGR